MLLATGALIVVAYLMLSINVYLESFALGRFSIGYGRLGPTEVRIVLIGLNVALALGAGLGFHVAGIGMTIFDVVGLAAAALMCVLMGGRAVSNLRRLSRDEPAAARF
jgi:archaetidylinositol phosphate synthase